MCWTVSAPTMLIKVDDPRPGKVDRVCIRHTDLSCKDATEVLVLDIVRHDARWGIPRSAVPISFRIGFRSLELRYGWLPYAIR